MSFYSNNVAAGNAAKTISSHSLARNTVGSNNLLNSFRNSMKEEKENMNPMMIMMKTESNHAVADEMQHNRPAQG